MANDLLNIGIILGSTRPGRVSPQVGTWILDIASRRGDAVYEIVDLADYRLPFLGDPAGEQQIFAWANKISALDAFIFVTAEYNHSITGALKNALDCAHRMVQQGSRHRQLRFLRRNARRRTFARNPRGAAGGRRSHASGAEFVHGFRKLYGV